MKIENLIFTNLKNNSMKNKYVTVWSIMGVIVIFLLTFFVFVLVLGEPYQQPQKQEQTDTAVFQYEVWDIIQVLPIQHKDIVFNQAKIESGNFTSKIFQEQNNTFGMRCPKQRPTTSIGCNKGYAVYETVYYSVVDYWIWQQIFAKNKSREQYLAYLSRVYATDKNYINKIN